MNYEIQIIWVCICKIAGGIMSPYARKYLWMCIGSIVVILFTKIFFPDFILTMHIWSTHGVSWYHVFYICIPLFIFGVGTNIFKRIFQNPPYIVPDPIQVLVVGFKVAILAGFLEELTYRGLFFIAGMVMLHTLNFLVFGWLGFGVVDWMYSSILLPIADWTSLGYLHTYLFDTRTWLIGGSIVYANVFFRDAHFSYGWLSWVVSWFLGMYFFYVMFTCGLGAAMLAHFLYDFLIFFTGAVMAWFDHTSLKIPVQNFTVSDI